MVRRQTLKIRVPADGPTPRDDRQEAYGMASAARRLKGGAGAPFCGRTPHLSGTGGAYLHNSDTASCDDLPARYVFISHTGCVNDTAKK